MTPEGKVKALVTRRMAEAFPDCYRFMAVQNGMGAPALDYFYCVEGRWIAIETKAPGKFYTPRQETTRDTIRKARGLVYLVDGPESLNRVILNIKWWIAENRPTLQTGEP